MSDTGTIISGSYSAGITLTSTGDNPVTVTGTITAPSGNALYGIGGTISGGDGALYGWSIANYGTISNSANGSSAIALGFGATTVANSIVTNEASGVISGVLAGVYIHGFGTVTNQPSGSITGSILAGIYIGSDPGVVVNGGTVLGGSYGVDEAQGGSVTNSGGETKGTITGTGNAGVQIAGGLGTIVSGGTILGGLYGTDEIAGGSVTNQSGGTITGTTSRAVYIRGGLGTVVNSGILLGGAFGVDEALGGSVTNLSGGSITGTGEDGVRIKGATGAVVNNGSVSGKYYGIYLGQGGSINNQSGGVITGTISDAIDVVGTTGTIVNSGSVVGTSYGIYERQGGSVTNEFGGTIVGSAFSAIRIGGTSGTIVNSGIVVGKYYGVNETQGGSVTNQSGGTIEGTLLGAIRIGGTSGTIVNAGSLIGSSFGIDIIPGTTGTITNSGYIHGANYGVYLGGGTLTNQPGGTFASNAIGVLLDSAGTIINGGTIDAGSSLSVAVQLAYGGSSSLIVDPGAAFYGQVAGGNGVIELAAGGAGTLSGFDGTSITNFASLQFETGADWTIFGDSSTDGLGTIVMGGFSVGDTIDLTDFAATSVAFASNQLVLTAAGGATDTLNMTGSFASADFSYIGDGGSGTDITVTATCYAAGTRICTTRGEVAVEHLREGDLVLTVSGRTQPISWIGHRHVNFQSHPNRQRILPVRIAAHAFGQGMPERDLLLSPDHAVFVEDVLIPIRHLINGGSIAQIECDTITYYHIELPRHDVLLADGMPAESYLEAGARGAFANVDGVIQLHPDFEPPRDHYAMLWEAEAYAPLVVAGEQLDRARCKLADRAAWPPFGAGVAAPPSSPLSANQ